MVLETTAKRYDLERYRDYLRILVELQLDPAMRGKVDLSGVVQQTLLEAHLEGEKRPQNEEEVMPWLRRILVNNLRDEQRLWTAQKRDVGREVSLDDAIEQSSFRMEKFIAADESRPDQQVLKNEQVLAVSVAMAKLPEAERQVLILKNWDGLAVSEIAERTGLSHIKVANSLRKALKLLREELDRHQFE